MRPAHISDPTRAQDQSADWSPDWSMDWGLGSSAAGRGARGGNARGGAAGSPWNVAAINSRHDSRHEADAPAPEADLDPLAPRLLGASMPRHLTPTTTTPAPAAYPFTWVAAHGGAGATSLARSTGVGGDLTSLWPAPALGWPTTVCVVARCNTAGLDAAARLLREAASGAVHGLTLAALVVVADSPDRPSKTQRRRLHELDAAAPAVVHLPWISTWRDQPYTPHPAATKVAATAAALAQT